MIKCGWLVVLNCFGSECCFFLWGVGDFDFYWLWLDYFDICFYVGGVKIRDSCCSVVVKFEICFVGVGNVESCLIG